MGGMMPMGGGGGGLPLGESDLESARRSGALPTPGRTRLPIHRGLKDPALGEKHGGTEKSDQDGALKDPPAGAKPETKPAGTEGATPPQEVTAGTGQVAPTGQPAPADTTVKLPNGATVTADSAALAKAGRRRAGGRAGRRRLPAGRHQLVPGRSAGDRTGEPFAAGLR